MLYKRYTNNIKYLKLNPVRDPHLASHANQVSCVRRGSFSPTTTFLPGYNSFPTVFPNPFLQPRVASLSTAAILSPPHSLGLLYLYKIPFSQPPASLFSPYTDTLLFCLREFLFLSLSLSLHISSGALQIFSAILVVAIIKTSRSSNASINTPPPSFKISAVYILQSSIHSRILTCSLMAQELDDGEFWLPSEFLTDDDLLLDFKTDHLKKKTSDGFSHAFGNSSAFNSNLSSPVESVMGSTETESDEDDCVNGRKVFHSTLQDSSFSTDNTSKVFTNSSS